MSSVAVNTKPSLRVSSEAEQTSSSHTWSPTSEDRFIHSVIHFRPDAADIIRTHDESGSGSLQGIW